jgi:ribonuclease T1
MRIPPRIATLGGIAALVPALLIGGQTATAAPAGALAVGEPGVTTVYSW